MDRIAIGQRIRALRKSKRYTQEALAEILDLSTAFVGQIERGEKHISVDTLVRISSTFAVSTDYILFGTNTYDAVDTIDDVKLQINDEKHQKYANMALDLIKAIIEEK